jgi:aminopeptidase YwaD
MLRWLRRLAILAAAIALAAFVYARCEAVAPRPDVAALIARIGEDQLRADVQRIAAVRPESDRQATAATLQWLEDTLRGVGYAPQREDFAAPMRVLTPSAPGSKDMVMTAKVGVPHCNLLAEKLGSSEPGTVLEVGAHFDSVPFGPGADDNGSGVAAVLEVARLLAAAAPRRTVRLCFFAMEEEGLVGSTAHVRLLAQRGDRIAGAIVLDMVGFATHAKDSQATPLRVPFLFSPPTTGDFLVVAGNFRSGWLGNLYEACADAYVPSASYYSVNRIAAWFADAMRSDHAPYWAAGFDAILLTDTAEMRNRNYHRPTDTPATIDFAFLRANAQALAATVLHWSGG